MPEVTAYDPITDHYVIYRKEGVKEYKKLAVTSETTYEDKTASGGIVYGYVVTAVQKDGNESGFSRNSSEKSETKAVEKDQDVL